LRRSAAVQKKARGGPIAPPPSVCLYAVALPLLFVLYGNSLTTPRQIPNVVAAAASILLTMPAGVKMYEKMFRQEFGNNPDTSKALRL
jgi:hypothetical protein